MQRSRNLVPLYLIFAASLLSARLNAADPPAPKKLASVEGITEYQLDNGLRLLLYPDNSRPKVTVNMTVLVGSRHEGYGETGMAHLLEHMVFKGTPTHPHIPRVLQEHGAQYNGTTSADRTNYFETLPASDENLEFAIRMEADRLVNSNVKREDLFSEMTVVRNEFERSENSPTAVLMKRIMAAAFEWHNYGKTTIGNRSDIERVPIENLRAFYQKHYQPDNVVLVVAGQFDEPKALALVQKYFGAIPRPTRKLDTTYTEEPEQDGERLVTLRRVGDVAAVGMAYHIPAGSHEDAPPLSVLGNILDTPPSGRLYKALIEAKKATSIFVNADGSHDPDLMVVAAEVLDKDKLEDVRDTIISVVEEIGEKGVTDEEVNRSKQQILKARELAAADTSRIAISLSEWASQGDWRLYFLHRDRIEKVTADDVKRVASRYLQRNNRTTGMFIPTEKPQRIAVPTRPDVKALVADYKGREAIAAGEAFDATPENIESRVKREEIEGVKVALLAKKTRGEEVQLELTLRYGDENSLKEFKDAASFLPELMLRGTKKLSYQQLRDELDRLKATLRAGAGSGRGRSSAASAGAVTFSIQTKRGNLPEVLGILKQVLREPALPAQEFDVLKRERLAELEQMRTEPSMLASRLLSRQLAPYSKDDIRYVPTIDELIKDVTAVTHEQVARLYGEFLGAQAGELTIVGDFDASASLPVLKESLSGWTAAKRYERIATPAPEKLAASQHKLNTPDKANATYMAGMLFPLRDDDPDYPALLMADYILGRGALSSRLGDRVRQKEGLSYGVGSNLGVSSLDKRAGLSIFAICNPQNIGKVEKAIQEEFDRLLRDGVSKEELDKARQGFLQSQKVRRTTDGALAGLLSELSHTGRTMEFVAELEKKIAALTPEEVLAAAKKHFDSKKLVIVTAGDFEAKGDSGG
jgi:zinc protease